MAHTDVPGERDRLFCELGAMAERAQSVDPIDQLGLPHLLCDAAGHAETWADVLERQASGREPAAFDSITCPVPMLHGHDDPHPGPEIRNVLRRHISQLRYREYPRCGHSPWPERHARTEFLQDLTTFLQAAQSTPATAA